MIVTYIHSNDPEDELQVRLRCRNFADAINRKGWHCANLLDIDAFTQNTPDAQRLCAASDLLVIHRYLYGPILQAIEYWKARDKKVIVDLDQAVNYLTSDIPGHAFWLEGKPRGSCTHGNNAMEIPIDPMPLEQFKWGLGMVNAAIVSSTRLVVDWSPYTDIHEIPDYLNTDQYPGIKQIHENEVWIGLTNRTRLASLKHSGLLKALENVCRKRLQVKLVLCDTDNDGMRLQDIRDEQLMVYHPNSFDEWADVLHNLDIGLMPIYGDYDLRMGRISLLEFMVSKIPWFASSQPSMRELSRYGRLIQNSPSTWEAAILKAVDNIDTLRRKAAGEPFLFALSQDVNENIDKVLGLFTYILNQGK